MRPGEVIRKAVGVVRAADEETPTGGFHVILSTPDLDRDGDELEPEDWKQPLPEHVTFDVDHGMSVATTVGSGTPTVEADGNLHVRGTFASTELAQNTRRLLAEGHIKHTSVAYRTLKGSKKRELLNGAFVAVPANPHAVVLSAKAATPLFDQVQRIHDDAVYLGALCDPGEDDGADKSLRHPVLDHRDDGTGPFVYHEELAPTSENKSLCPTCGHTQNDQASTVKAPAEAPETTSAPAAAAQAAVPVDMRAKALELTLRLLSLSA